MDALADTSIFVLVFATLAQAWSWLGAYAASVSFGHAMFFGIGAYAVAVSNLRGGSPWYGALGGALFAVIVALICGLLFLRGRGYTFAAVTLILGALAQPFVTAHTWVGPRNAFIFPLRPGFLNLQFEHKWPYVLIALCVFAVVQALTFGLRWSAVGRRLRALRTNPAAARSVGVRELPQRLLVLAGSAFVTSVAGSFLAEYTLAVTPHAMFALSLSFDIAFIGVISGPASAWGPPLAALAYVLVAREIPLHPAGVGGSIVLVVQGLVIAFIAWLRPQGVWGAGLRRSPARRIRSAA